MDKYAHKTLKGLLAVPKRYRLNITELQPFERGYSARLFTDAKKDTVKLWLKQAGITKYRLQFIIGERVNYYRLEFTPTLAATETA